MTTQQEALKPARTPQWPFIPVDTLNIVHAEGCTLTTDDGRRILDAAGGAIVANIGHGRTRVVERMHKALSATSYVIPPWNTPDRIAVVEELQTHWLTERFQRIHMTSGGTEAIEAAMKMAIHYQAATGHPGRTKILSRSLSYHGTTLATTAASGHVARKRGLESAVAAVTTVQCAAVPTPYPLRYNRGANDPDMGTHYVQALRAAIEAEGPDQVAALLAEPISGSSGGALVPPEDYWPGVRAVCDEFGILLIHDEVMTGFGRTGTPFAHQHWDTPPDILVSGKGLAGGYAPLGGVYAGDHIADALRQAGFGVMFNTFGAHTGACAAAVEVLTIIREEALIARAQKMGDHLSRLLKDRFDGHPHVAESRGRGLLQAIEIVADRASLTPYPLEAGITQTVVSEALKRGVFFYGGGTGEIRDIVCMGPPFIIESAQLEQIVDVLGQAVDAATGH